MTKKQKIMKTNVHELTSQELIETWRKEKKEEIKLLKSINSEWFKEGFNTDILFFTNDDGELDCKWGIDSTYCRQVQLQNNCYKSKKEVIDHLKRQLESI